MQRASGGVISGAFISIRASDIILSDIGGSEKLLVQTFDTARRNAPSVIFIDEFEAIFTSRDGNGSGNKGSSRLVGTLLQCMDDAKRWRDADFAALSAEKNMPTHLSTSLSSANYNKGRVVILGATNAPWSVDKAFLRPGRFSKVVYVGLPNKFERGEIINVHLRKMKLRMDEYNSRDEAIQALCEKIALSSEGFSGADLVGLCRAAAVQCLHEYGSDATNIGVDYRHFAMARENIKPSCDPALVQRLLNWKLSG